MGRRALVLWSLGYYALFLFCSISSMSAQTKIGAMIGGVGLVAIGAGAQTLATHTLSRRTIRLFTAWTGIILVGVMFGLYGMYLMGRPG